MPRVVSGAPSIREPLKPNHREASTGSKRPQGDAHAVRWYSGCQQQIQPCIVLEQGCAVDFFCSTVQAAGFSTPGKSRFLGISSISSTTICT